MIRRPPRSTLDRSSAASDVYKRQPYPYQLATIVARDTNTGRELARTQTVAPVSTEMPVSYTHLRAHETVLDIVCRLLLEKKKHMIAEYSVLVQYRIIS